MTIFRVQHDKEFVILERKIIKNKNLSPEAKAYYAMIEAEIVKISEIPVSILKELISIGYLEDLKQEMS